MADDANPRTPRTLSILIPVHNEVQTLAILLGRVIEAPLPCEREIVAVDDASTDGSYEVLQRFAETHPATRVLRHTNRRGKGAAIRTALAHATGDWAIIQDADLEYDPNDYVALLQPIIEHGAEAVFGTRFSPEARVQSPRWHVAVNRFLTFAANRLCASRLTDMATCYKLVRLDVWKRMDLRSDGFEIEAEIVAKLARLRVRVNEVPVTYRKRAYAEGKKIKARDGVRMLLALMRYRFLRS